jgi:hypothetical protein
MTSNKVFKDSSLETKRGAKSVAQFHEVRALALPGKSERATSKAPRRSIYNPKAIVTDHG